jgi:hypothetical protein
MTSALNVCGLERLPRYLEEVIDKGNLKADQNKTQGGSGNCGAIFAGCESSPLDRRGPLAELGSVAVAGKVSGGEVPAASD